MAFATASVTARSTAGTSTRTDSRNASSLRRARAQLSGSDGSVRASVSIRNSGGTAFRGRSILCTDRSPVARARYWSQMLEEVAPPASRWPLRSMDADQRLYAAKVVALAAVYYGAAKLG